MLKTGEVEAITIPLMLGKSSPDVVERYHPTSKVGP
jgi:hypothetical protein